jgi:hypothetical protein
MVRSKIWETVRIRRDGQKIFVQPICPELRCLKTTSIEPVDDPNHGFQLCRVPVPLYELYPDSGDGGEISFPKGLEPVARAVLAKNGRQIDTLLVGPKTAELPTPIPAPWLGGRLPYQHAVNWIHENRGGILRADPSRLQVDHLIQSIVLAFPEISLAIVDESIARLNHLSSQLSQLNIHATIFTAARDLENRPNLTLSTLYGAGWRHVSQLDLILLLDGTQALTERREIVLADATRARIFGIVPITRQLNNRESDELLARFGFARIEIAGPNQAARPIRTHFMHLNTCGQQLQGEEAKGVRLALQSSPGRNRRIIQLARDLSARRTMVFAARSQREQVFGRGVAIVVESPQHAARLAKALPDWQVVTANSLKSLINRDRDLLAIPFGAVGWKFIVTLTALPRMNLDGIDFVIRAASGPELLEIDPISKFGDETPIAIVDFKERHHRLLSQWYRNRRNAYRKAGWMACSLDLLQARVEQFLQDRGL